MAGNRWRVPSYFALAVLLVCLDYCVAYSQFRDRIPNGQNVPHPCNPVNARWRGVGHVAEGGGGARNPFGMDFDAANKEWTQELCKMDSDGDGKTNGEELGDPGCTWTPNTQPSGNAVSHPGFCDPVGSSACVGRLPDKFCDNQEFQCSALQEDGVTNHSVRFPKTPVPAKETTYKCMLFEFPQDKDYHMTAFVEEIDVVDVMHHIVVYGCEDEESNKNPLDTPYDCFMSGGGGCETFLGIWALGQHGYCFHPNAGITIGMNGYKRAVLELHWNNPMKSSAYQDSSGIKFYLNPNLRQYEAGILSVGPVSLNIPPGEESHTETGICNGECTRELMKGPINVVAVTNHMHYLGKQAVSKVIRGNIVEYLAYDMVYDYDKPVMYQFADPITVNPGDKIEIDCVFSSMSRNKTTEWGFETNSEMCYSFITYYPKENLGIRDCHSFKDVSSCELESEQIRGCNISSLSDPNNPLLYERYRRLSENCVVGYCKKECMAEVKWIKEDPCYKQPVLDYLMSYSRYLDCDGQRFYAWLTSCDKEFYIEMMKQQNDGKDDTSMAVTSSISEAFLIGAMSAVLVFQ